MSDYTIHLLSEAVSPITHAARSEGNESIVAREPVRTERGVRWVPCLSGNALRHRLVREPGARFLVEQLGLAGKLSLEQLNFLFHGGNLTESNAHENTKRIAEMQELFPLLRLIGGSLPDQILAGSLHVWRGMLVCEETRGLLSGSLPKDWTLDDAPLRPAESFVSGYQYTRSDARKTARDLLPADPEGGESNLIIFAGQSVMPGAMFLHGFLALHPNQLEIGALLHSLWLWSKHGTIGGQAARGHGRLKTALLGDDPARGEAVAAYLEHIQANADRCREWLADVFAERAAKKEKKTKKQLGFDAVSEAA